MRDFFLADGPVFRHGFYTTGMAYDRRERDPFPPVNVYHWGGLVLVQALLPGLQPSDVDVRLENGHLYIEGVVPRLEGRYYREERYSGPFCRRVELGVDVVPRPRVGFQDGILQVIFRRRKKA
ncbi:Hsp20/alpha crystallin family protein [Mailhella sp.]|uniref:Hsp20/alpha crystallin family protein n=1 Tax=Mailhella sp. TaxID=1981029 RepID=UPI004064A230